MSYVIVPPKERTLNIADWLKPELAMELAAKLQPVEVICLRYGLSTHDLQQLLEYPAFRAMVRQAKETWSSDMNAEQRVRAKAALAVEDTIPDLHGIVVDEKVQPRQRSDAWAKLARVAQLDAPPAPGGSGGQYNLTINLPGSDTIAVSAPVIDLDAEE